VVEDIRFRGWSLTFKGWVLVFRVSGLRLGSEFWVYGSGFRVKGYGV
jgi:hypothetical protein